MHGSAYTAEDIKRYLRGDMSPAEMHALEKAALDDPFLADAIEGMQAAPASFDADVKQLRTNIDMRKNQRSTSGVFWRIAAILLLLVTAVAFVIILGKKQPQAEERTLAKVERVEDSAVIKHESEVKELPELSKTENKKEPGPKTFVPPAKPARAPVEKSEDVVLAPLNEESVSIADRVEEPVARTDTHIQKALQGRAAGVQVDKNARLKEVDKNASLEEVVVVGYGTRKKARNNRNKSIVPDGGWLAFDDYINENKSIMTADSSKKGKQVVNFVIDENGRPTNITIRRSISPAHDKEATRLLEAGPDWNILKGLKRKVRLEIEF